MGIHPLLGHGRAARCRQSEVRLIEAWPPPIPQADSPAAPRESRPARRRSSRIEDIGRRRQRHTVAAFLPLREREHSMTTTEATTFEQGYQKGYLPGTVGARKAPWDIQKAQSAVVELAAKGAFSGAVLDIGSGLGDN